jgi:hypothetical protein
VPSKCKSLSSNSNTEKENNFTRAYGKKRKADVCSRKYVVHGP